MNSATKYGLYFFGVFLASCFGVLLLLYTNIHPHNNTIGYWKNFDEPGYFFVTISPGKINLLDEKHRLNLNGRWFQNAFYSSPSPGQPEKIIARQLMNEDLELQMSAFYPRDSRVLICVKYMRNPNEHYPLPINQGDEVMDYPPPKNMLHPGVLEADLKTLPWHAYQITSNYTSGKSGARGNPEIYHYKSDHPDVPELKVSVEEGRVTMVSGGYEDSNAAAYVPPSPPKEVEKLPDEPKEKSWLHRLYDVLLGS